MGDAKHRIKRMEQAAERRRKRVGVRVFSERRRACPDEGRERDVGHGEESFQQGLVFGRRLHVAQDGDRRDQQGVVGQRGEKLRRHDDVKPAIHR